MQQCGIDDPDNVNDHLKEWRDGLTTQNTQEDNDECDEHDEINQSNDKVNSCHNNDNQGKVNENKQQQKYKGVQNTGGRVKEMPVQ